LNLLLLETLVWIIFILYSYLNLDIDLLLLETLVWMIFRFIFKIIFHIFTLA